MGRVPHPNPRITQETHLAERGAQALTPIQSVGQQLFNAMLTMREPMDGRIMVEGGPLDAEEAVELGLRVFHGIATPEEQARMRSAIIEFRVASYFVRIASVVSEDGTRRTVIVDGCLPDLPESGDVGDLVNLPDDGRLWLPEEAAVFLKVPRSLIMALARKDLLPCVRVGRFIRYRREDLEAWAKGGGSVPREGVRRGDH
jgi:excisionase family DNA binding protein